MKYSQAWSTALKVSGEGELGDSHSEQCDEGPLERSCEGACEEGQGYEAGALEEAAEQHGC